MRDRHVKRVFRTHPRYYCLDIEFDGEPPRLNDTKSICELQLKAQEDHSISKVINNIARYAIVFLFYFELDFMLEGCNREHTDTSIIFCLVRQSDPIFTLLLDQLSNTTFYLNNYPIPGQIGDYSFIYKDRNFQKQIELSLSGRFMISLK
jgi:hypothetical protein